MVAYLKIKIYICINKYNVDNMVKREYYKMESSKRIYRKKESKWQYYMMVYGIF